LSPLILTDIRSAPKYRLSLLLLLACMAGQQALSQITDISGVVNQYGRIKRIWSYNEDNPDSVIVDGASAIWDGSSPFEIALFVQVKGTDVEDRFNNPGSPSAWGRARNGLIRNTGKYCFMLVDRVVNDSIVIFSSSLVIRPNEQGSIPFTAQLIKVPYAKSFRLTGDLVPPEWDPVTKTGGVLALFAAHKLDLSGHNIRASGKGFLGGDTLRDDPGPVICASEDKTFYLDTADHLAGRRGASIVYEGYPYTRGNNYVLGAGGGGQGRYSGGAGGSNAGVGGRGGSEEIACPFGYFGWMGTLNSAFYGNEQNRLFLGSGGGGAVPEPGSTATPGGNGGGIVIIITDTLAGLPAEDTIFASGESVMDLSYTGGGGGGAGGFIVLDINYIKGMVHLDVSGGKGGYTYDPVLLHGPGGGGGGGVIWHSGSALPSGLTENKSGGDKGDHLGISGTHNAGGGNAGITLPDLVVPLRGFYFNFLTGDQDICQDSIPTIIFGSYPKGDTAFVFEWQDSISGGSWQNITGAAEKDYSPDTLTVTTWFRRIVTPVSEPTETDTSGLVRKKVFNRLRNNVVAANDTICYDLIPAPLVQAAPQITGGDGVSRLYRWQVWQNSSPGWVSAGFLAQDGFDDKASTFVSDRLRETTYFRRQVISHVCTHISDSLTITVLPDITGNAITGIDTVCQFTQPGDSIRGPVPGGGDGVYEYLWEARSDAGDWTSSVAASRNYFPGSMDTVTTRYRRRVYSGNHRACESLSNTVSIEVHPIIQQNSIAPDTAVCAETPTHDIYPDATIFGGNGTYLYRFERSTDLAGWPVARDWSPAGRYDPIELPETSWFRRIVESGKCTDTSSIIKFYVDTVILNNLISPDDTICAGTASAAIIGSVASGGDWSAYSYIWDKSTDRQIWTAGIHAGSDLPSQVLYDSTWYRRRVLSGVCFDTSALVVVNVHDTITGNLVWPDSILTRDACVDLPKIIRGQNENDGLEGGTGRPQDYLYLWEKFESQSGLWNDAPAGGYLSNDHNNYQTEVLTDSIYTFRRFVISGKCSNTSEAVSLVVKPRPVGLITSDPTPTDTCYTGTDIGIVITVRFDEGLKPYTLYYSDGQGGADVLPEPLDFYDGSFTVFRGSTDSSWYTIRIDSIIDENGCRAVMPGGGQGYRQMIVYRDQPPSLVQDTFKVCGGEADIAVVGGLGSLRYWGPDSADYSITPRNNPAAVLTLNNWRNDTVFYTLAWSQKNGVCPLNSVSTILNLYQTPLPARVDPETMQIYFRETMPLWADSAVIGLGTWKDWDWEVENQPPVTDIHNNRAEVNLGGTENMKTPVTRKLTWVVNNGVCPANQVEVTIERYDLQLYSAFSPNGDLFNEYLILDGLEFADQFTLRIFSRYGRLIKTVTEADKMTNPVSGEENAVWDGRMEDGSEAEDGTYFYMIEVIHAGQKYNYKNYLELVRSDPNR
jgi:gliding motility-associated-like protein